MNEKFRKTEKRLFAWLINLKTAAWFKQIDNRKMNFSWVADKIIIMTGRQHYFVKLWRG
jgi:hypothetical protein